MVKYWVAGFACALLSISQARAANLVSDGNFESPVVPNPNSFTTYFGTQSFSGWSVTGNASNSVDLIRDSSTAGEGSQYVDLSGQAIGGITQTLTTVPGQTYSLDFLFAGNYGAVPTIITMDLFWNGSKIASPTFDRTGHSASNIGWAPLHFDVVATSSSTVLQFQSTTAGAFGPFVDQVSVVSTPEPSSLAILGVAGVGLCRRRRRSA